MANGQSPGAPMVSFSSCSSSDESAPHHTGRIYMHDVKVDAMMQGQYDVDGILSSYLVGDLGQRPAGKMAMRAS